MSNELICTPDCTGWLGMHTNECGASQMRQIIERFPAPSPRYRDFTPSPDKTGTK